MALIMRVLILPSDYIIDKMRGEREIAKDYDDNIVYCECGKPLYIDDIDEENNFIAICENTDCEY